MNFIFLSFCVFFFIFKRMSFCNANNLESGSPSLNSIIASRKLKILYSSKDGKKLNTPYENLHSDRLRGCGIAHLLWEVSDSLRLAATWEASRWKQVHAWSCKRPVQCAQPVEVESRSSFWPKAEGKRVHCSPLLEKAKAIFLAGWIAGWTWSSCDKVHRMSGSIVKALKSFADAFTWMV